MEKTIKILHVDMNWDVVYILIRGKVAKTYFRPA